MANNDNKFIDDLDFTILAHLQKEGRKPFSQIAQELGLAIGTVRNRVLRMLEDKTLSIIARVNPQRVGFNAYTTILVSILPACLGESSKVIAEFPEVSYLALITGEFDVMVDVMCRDTQHLMDFLINRLAKVEGVKDFKTMLILDVYQFAQPDLKLARQLAPEIDKEPLNIR
jgi:Lrp/AsnC family transcriptional regulator, regulator for asnA, asnC and gidA